MTGFAFASNTLCCHFNLHIKNGSLHLITLSYCQCWKGSIGVSSRAETPCLVWGAAPFKSRGRRTVDSAAFYYPGSRLLFGSECYWCPCPRVAIGEIFGNVLSIFKTLHWFPWHTWNRIRSLDHGPQGPTGFGLWPPLSSLCHILPVGSSPATVANSSSAVPSLHPSGSALCWHSFPAINTSVLHPRIYSAFTSSLYLTSPALPSLFLFFKALPTNHTYLFIDLVHCLPFPLKHWRFLPKPCTFSIICWFFSIISIKLKHNINWNIRSKLKQSR